MEDEKTAAQAEMLGNRLAKKYKHLRKWAKRIGTEAFRLYDRDIPEIPLLIEIYGDAALGALYERPYDKPEAEELVWLQAMSEATAKALGLSPSRVFLKLRKRQRGPDQYERLAEAGETGIVKEGGLSFKVNYSDYLDSGLFLDHRKTRDIVRSQASGKRMLNLFCYTASFSVYAAAGGTSETDSIDLSNTYLTWAKENFTLNGLDAVMADPLDYNGAARPAGRNRLVRADALRFLSEATRSGKKWDIIILDPPTFSNSKKMASTLDVRRDYRELLDLTLRSLSPGGVLWFSTNARGFTLDPVEFPGIAIEDQTEKTRDEDFKDRKIRSCYTFRP